MNYREAQSMRDACCDVSFDADAAVKWITDKMRPEEVFSVKELEQWALDNGFTPAKDNE